MIASPLWHIWDTEGEREAAANTETHFEVLRGNLGASAGRNAASQLACKDSGEVGPAPRRCPMATLNLLYNLNCSRLPQRPTCPLNTLRHMLLMGGERPQSGRQGDVDLICSCCFKLAPFWVQLYVRTTRVHDACLNIFQCSRSIKKMTFRNPQRCLPAVAPRPKALPLSGITAACSSRCSAAEKKKKMPYCF